jgi:crotonobetainyl-CoA:carnitine CoA-transferase CaiB-like acyl-CoA transferase
LQALLQDLQRQQFCLISALTSSRSSPPGTGDPYRYFSNTPPNPVADINYAWQLTNRNKRSIALDLKSKEAKEVLNRLIRWADVVVINFPPRVKASLGLGYEELSALNPRLIYADITGYGSAGPEAETPGFDVTAYWARSGLMEVTHDAGSPPTLPIPGIGDHATATTLYAAIVTALYTRERTGQGGPRDDISDRERHMGGRDLGGRRSEWWPVLRPARQTASAERASQSLQNVG